MEVKASAKYIRISPRKVQVVLGAIKGKPVESALKVIRSAVANADQQPDVDIDLLVVRDVVAHQGPVLKRWRARARGRAARILKRTSHITVILEEESSV